MFARPSIGEVVAGRYELRDEFGSTPSRVAYRAFDREVEVEVTLWWLRPDFFGGADCADQIEAAIASMRGLRESHILRPFGAGQVGEPSTVYVTWQLGTTSRLEGLLAQGEPAALVDFILYAKGLASAVEVAHHNGLYHGWLAPADVVEVAGLVKVCGFGIYPAMDAEAALRAWDRDRRYLAPEVLGEGREAASDWYAIAAILLDLAVGNTGLTLQDAQRELQSLSPDRHAALAPALSSDPQDRPQSADEFLGPIFDAWGVTGEVQLLPSVIAEGGQQGANVGTRSFLDEDEDEMTLVHPGALEAVLKAAQSVVVDTPPPESTTAERPRPSPDRVETSDLYQAREAQTRELHMERQETEHRLGSSDLTPMEDSVLSMVADSPRAMGRRPAMPLPKVPTPLPEDDETLVDASVDLQLEMVSMKAPEPSEAPEHKTIAKPVLRPLSSLAGAAEQRPELGYLAPPRARAKTPQWVWLLLALVAGAGAVGLVLFFTDMRGRDEASAIDDSEPQEASSAAASRRDKPSPVTPPPALITDQLGSMCPSGMSYVESRQICIETHESPGEGRLPETGLSLELARAQCAARHRKLCSGEDWEAACRRKGSSSWPYGSAFQSEICNVQSGRIARAGSHSQCKTLVGVYDMSGNTAEWVEDGAIRGGSAMDGTEGRCSQFRPKPGRQDAYSDVGYRCCADPVASPRASD